MKLKENPKAENINFTVKSYYSLVNGLATNVNDKEENRIKGYDNYFGDYIELAINQFKVIEGRIYKDKEVIEIAEVCLITFELASRNNWIICK